jgi:hypothetical protein
LKLLSACLLVLLLFPLAAVGQDRAPLVEKNSTVSRHQDSSHLGLATSAVLPADGLVSVGLGFRKYSTVYQLNGLLETIDQMDMSLRTEIGPLPWLQISAEIPYRTWSGGQDWIPESGGGLADGTWQATLGAPLLSSHIYGALYGGGNLLVGSSGQGLTEGVFSPRAGGALTLRLWSDKQVPEMRLHLNLGYRWNKAEEHGYGMGQQGFQPWAPRYPSSRQVGGDSANDQMLFRTAVEFRKETTSLWIEYSRDRFGGTDLISVREQFSAIGAGFRWGVVERWALHGAYMTSLMKDDPDSGWDPAYPEWVMQVGVSRQFSFGGNDRDDDGIVDRKDHCPDRPEDIDGFQDEDGCPDEDNDQDGIPDPIDGAPNEAEDFDDWQDFDGIPDPDNDGDGILDPWDLCPNEPEDMDGHRDGDGCPDDFVDQDGDGIGDEVDGCPEVAEDRDGFDDDDGCPDLDNDLDGIEDDKDVCPDDAEDYDGVDDEDGCPE